MSFHDRTLESSCGARNSVFSYPKNFGQESFKNEPKSFSSSDQKLLASGNDSYTNISLLSINQFLESQPNSLVLNAQYENPKPIYKNVSFSSPFPVHAIDWSKSSSLDRNWHGFFITGSFQLNNRNQSCVYSFESCDNIGSNLHTINARPLAYSNIYSYPWVKCMWEPGLLNSNEITNPTLLASASNSLDLWSLTDIPEKDQTSLNLLSSLSSKKSSLSYDVSTSAPLTSFDWCKIDPNLIITSSIDTTCTLWDIVNQKAKTQLIAHDQEVYDVAFMARSNTNFCSVGADGSLRLFDLRSLDHSTVLFEVPNSNTPTTALTPKRTSPSSPLQNDLESQHKVKPLLRLSTCSLNSNHLATFQHESNTVFVVDIRWPGRPLFNLAGHTGAVSSVQWSPTMPHIIASASEDSHILIWNLNKSSSTPFLSYNCGSPITNIAWNKTSDWISIVS